MRKIQNYFLLSLCGVAVTITGCDSLKRGLGLERRTPDEFTVLQRAPLEIPSDLSTLPLPRPGAPRPQDVSAKDMAKIAVLGVDAPVAGHTDNQMSAAEAALLNQTGAAQAPDNIRATVTSESKEYDDKNRPVVKRLLSVGSDTPPATIVDAEAEHKRIQDAKKAGKSATEGETPLIEE